jgi:imidazolonepropionase-like amidohydrolase
MNRIVKVFLLKLLELLYGRIILSMIFLLNASLVYSQTEFVLIADRLFDGRDMHEGWGVRIKENKIVAVGPVASISTVNAEVRTFEGGTIIPGMIEGHSHFFLRPYNEMSWNEMP